MYPKGTEGSNPSLSAQKWRRRHYPAAGGVVVVVVGHGAWQRSGMQKRFGCCLQSVSLEQGVALQLSLTEIQHVWQPSGGHSHCSGATRTHCCAATGQAPSQRLVVASKRQGVVVVVVDVVAVVVEVPFVAGVQRSATPWVRRVKVPNWSDATSGPGTGFAHRSL